VDAVYQKHLAAHEIEFAAVATPSKQPPVIREQLQRDVVHVHAPNASPIGGDHQRRSGFAPDRIHNQRP